MSNRPRIKDVARLAGTSVSTVSNYLNGRPHRMAADTVLRVERAIENLGYRRSWAALQLKTGAIPVLGLLVPSMANPFHGALARYIEEAALARGFKVVFGNSLRDPLRERQYAEDFWGFGIRGLIVGSSPLGLDHLADLVPRGLCIVVFDRGVDATDAEPVVDSVSMDNCLAGYMATRHLIELGHRRIGYISGATLTASRRDRLLGYTKAMTEAGLSVDPALVSSMTATVGFDDTSAAEHGRIAALELLTANPGLTALVALNDMHALGACAAVREQGGTVPGDVSAVSIDDVVLANIVDPPLTAVRHPIEALSVAAVERLVERLQGRAVGPPRHVVLAPDLVVRGSTAAPRAATKSAFDRVAILAQTTKEIATEGR